MKKQLPLVRTPYSFSADIPRELVFAFVSDLHCCENDPVIELLQEIQPDAVLVGGDFIHDHNRRREGIEFLTRSAALWPTYCSIGNHELRYRGDLHALVRPTGAVLLDNASVNFGGVEIGGLTSALRDQGYLSRRLHTQVPDLGWLHFFSSKPGYKLLLCHHPEYYPKYIRKLPIDLILAGHTHGGQWRPFNRAVYAPGQGLLPKYSAGIYEDRLLVGKGVGNTAGVPRINDDPEILEIRLIPKKNP